jgi:hypothetical protein
VTVLHECFGELPSGGYGSAIDGCDELDDGTLWISNGEYSSQVLFCPYCGFRARTIPPGFDAPIPKRVLTAMGSDLVAVAAEHGLERYSRPETDAGLRERLVDHIRKKFREGG